MTSTSIVKFWSSAAGRVGLIDPPENDWRHRHRHMARIRLPSGVLDVLERVFSLNVSSLSVNDGSKA